MWEAALSSTERFVGTYCARGIDTDPGSLQEAQDNASPGGDTKGSKKDHVLRWGQGPGAKRPPRRMSGMLRLKNAVDGGRGR